MCLLLFCFQSPRSLCALLLPLYLLPFLPCALMQGIQRISRCHPHTHLDRLVLSLPSCLPASGVVDFKSRRAAKTGVLFIILFSAFKGHQTSKRDTSAECSFILFPYKRVSLFSSLQELPVFTLSLLTKAVFIPLFLLSLKGVLPSHHLPHLMYQTPPNFA